MLRRKSRR